MTPLPELPNLNTVHQAIALALAPIFMLSGIGAFLSACVSRLARIIDRARAVERLVLETPAGKEHDRHVWEVRRLDRRMGVVNNAIFLSVMSALLVCIVVVLLFLAALIRPPLGPAIATTFISAMGFLMAALVSFLVEVRMAARTIRIRREILDHRHE